jgi:NAD(P)-dependent dehydrogenase (short-subunit alcohol dehydrogenase family)
MEKFAFVTGAASGLGRATAFEFAKAGYTVLASVRREEDGRALRRELPGLIPIQIDLADDDAIEAAIQAVDGQVGDEGLAALVNNAGYAFYSPVEYTPKEEIDRLFDVLVFGPARLTNGLLPALRRYTREGRNRARVLNVISWASLDASPFVGYYSAAKAAFLRLTQSQHYEFDRYGIDAVAVVPGLMKTPFVAGVAKQIAGTLERLSPEGREVYGRHLQNMASMSAAAQSNPLVSKPEDFAKRIVSIVASPRVRFQYNLGIDTALIEIMNGLLPFFALRRMKVAMFGLGR